MYELSQILVDNFIVDEIQLLTSYLLNITLKNYKIRLQ